MGKELTRKILEDMGFKIATFTLEGCYAMSKENKDIYVSIHLEELGADRPTIYATNRKTSQYLQYRNPFDKELDEECLKKCMDVVGIEL